MYIENHFKYYRVFKSLEIELERDKKVYFINIYFYLLRNMIINTIIFNI